MLGSAAQPETEDESPLPELQIDERLQVSDMRIIEKKTKPAPLHTEASLLAAMESAGRELADEAQREAMKASVSVRRPPVPESSSC